VKLKQTKEKIKMIKRKIYKYLFYNPRTDELGIVFEQNGMCLVDVGFTKSFYTLVPWIVELVEALKAQPRYDEDLKERISWLKAQKALKKFNKFLDEDNE
jgi:hypothetical protein